MDFYFLIMENNIDLIQTLVVDGVECLSTRMACEVTGHSRTSFLSKVKKEKIETLKKDNGRTYYKKDSLRDAINRGAFIKWA